MELQETDSHAKVQDHLEPANQDADVQLSKNQLKKLKKRERWLANKPEIRRNAKLKRKLRLAEMRENGEDTGPTRKSLKRKTMKNSTCKIKIVIDLSLDEYMAEKDVNSLTCQLQHCYSANRRADNPMQLYFCGISGKTKERLDRIGDYKGWDIYPKSQTYEKVFPAESLVYLSSESSNVLTTLSEDKVYVIGGLVDHNKHKGLCHRLAEEKGISHAQLPIADYLDMKTRRVLTVNQVFSILLRYTETKDWEKAFLAEMPQRKNVNLKEASSTQSSASTAGDEHGSPKDTADDELLPCAVTSEELAETTEVTEKPAEGSEDLRSVSTAETGSEHLEECDRSNPDEADEINTIVAENLDQNSESTPKDESR